MSSITDINLSTRMQKLWKFSLFFYFICSIAFASKSSLMFLNSIALYFFLGVSFICIIINKSIKVNLFFISNTIFALFMLLGVIYAPDISQAFSTFYYFFIALCLMFCVINYITEEKDIKIIITAIMFGGFALNIYTVYLYGADFVDTMLSEARIGDVAGNLNEVGIKSCFSALIALFFILNDDISFIKKTVYFAIFCVCSFFALITASKKVLILIVLGVFFLFLFRRNKKRKPFAIFKNLLISLAIVGLVILVIYNVGFFESIVLRFEELLDLLFNGGGTGSDQKRVRFIREGFQVFLDNPIFGDGTAASHAYFGTYSHCNFIEILMNYGAIGFVLYYLCYPPFFIKTINKMRTNKNNRSDLSVLCFFFVASLTILSVGLVYYTVPYFQLLIAVSMAYINFDDKKNLL